MKKSINQTTEGDIAERNALTRKLYRYISEAARRVDEGTARSKSVVDLFAATLEIYRQKLRENCEKLIFADPLLFGRKAQELLWRKGYYEAVSTAKRLRANQTTHDELILAHIDAGIGHYHYLISKVQIEAGIQLRGLVDYPQLDTEFKCNNADKESELKDWGKSCIQTFLVYLGDLSRYKTDYEDHWNPSMAARYYLQAAGVNPLAGMPYNQLGTLYTGKNHHLDSVRYYIMCLMCINSFEGAESNLMRIFDKNAKYLENCNPPHPDIIDQQESVKSFICKFLSLTDVWFFQKNFDNFNDLCASTLYDLKECLQYRPLVTPDLKTCHEDYLKYLDQNEINPEYLNSKIIYKFVVVSLLCMDSLQSQNSSNLYSLKAFALAALSQLLQRLLTDFTEIGFQIENPEDAFETYKNEMKHLKQQYVSQKDVKNGLVKTTQSNCDKIIEDSNMCSNVIVPETPTKDDDDDSTENKKNDSKVSEETGEGEGETVKNVDIQVKLSNGIGPLKNGDKAQKTKPKKNNSHAKLRRRRRRLDSFESTDKSDSDNSTDFSDLEDNKGSDQSCSEDNVSEESYSSNSSSEDENDDAVDAKDQSKLYIDNNTTKNDTSNLDGNSEKKEKEEVLTEKDDSEMKEQHLNGDVKENDIPEKKEFNEDLLKEFFESDNILIGLKLLLNWLYGEADLVISCKASGRALFQTLVDVLNIIHRQIFPKMVSNHYKSENQFHESLSGFHESFFALKYSYKTKPLPEDVEVKSLRVMERGLRGMNWDSNEYFSTREANTVRLMRFIDFGVFIAKLKIGIVYNKRLKLYILKKDSGKKVHANHKKESRGPYSKYQKPSVKNQNTSSQAVQDSEKGASNNNNNLMKNLGRMWLSEQVRELESAVRSGRKQRHLPPYAVVDADALCHHTHLVKQLVYTKKVIVLIPTIVLQSMDELKKESGGARSAIRWLEIQLRNGSRFLRAQRPSESAPLPCVKYPKKMHRDVQNFIQIIEFCHYFLSKEAEDAAEGGNKWNGDGSKETGKADDNANANIKTKNKSNNIVVLLTGSNELINVEQKDFSFTGVAQTAGVTIENIQEFCTKWKNSFGKGGRKR